MPLFCPKCGNKLHGNFKFCPTCGKNLEGKFAFCSECGKKMPMAKKAKTGVSFPKLSLRIPRKTLIAVIVKNLNQILNVLSLKKLVAEMIKLIFIGQMKMIFKLYVVVLKEI